MCAAVKHNTASDLSILRLLISPRAQSTAMRTALGIHASISQAQSFHRPPSDQVFCNNFFRIFRLNVAVPHSLRVNHNGGSVLTLIQASRLVDAHLSTKPSFSRKLLQPGVQATGSIGCARRPRRISGADVMADKDVTFKRGQVAILLEIDRFQSNAAT